MKEIKPEIAIIIRSDEVIKNFNLKRITVNTSFGPVDRCFIGEIYGVNVLFIYGRFNGQKVPSNYINHQQTVEVIKNLKINKAIGTFVVGGINPTYPQGCVHIVTDLIGMGNYKISWNCNNSFHNAEMIEPFCPHLLKELNKACDKMNFSINRNSTYVCFCGYPRIETKAELKFYESIGGDIVGQTLDPEATLMRLNGICYAAIAVQIDDPISRNGYAQNLKCRKKTEKYKESIESCRARTTSIVLQFLKDYKNFNCNFCNKMKRENKSFREFPASFYE